MADAAQKRTFIEGGRLDALFEIIEGMTSAQASAIVRGNDGLWAQTTGSVIDVTDNVENVAVSILLENRRDLFMTFARSGIDTLMLHKQDEVTVQGRITVSDSGWIRLADCEIVSHATASEIALRDLKLSLGSKLTAPASDEPVKAPPPVPPQADTRKNLPTPEAKKFCEFLLKGWPDVSEREAHKRAVGFYPDNKVPRDWFWDIFRAIRGPKTRGVRPKNRN